VSALAALPCLALPCPALPCPYPCLSDRQIDCPCPCPALPLPHVPKQTDPSFLET